MNFARFRPLAAGRGLPLDISPTTKQLLEEFEGSLHGETWISCKEIKQIDWEEEAELVDERIHEYRRTEQGKLLYQGKAGQSREFAEKVGYDQCIGDQEQEWDLGDVVYRREKLKRKDVKASWDLAFAVLEPLCARYGEEHVRLVVWFD